MIKEKELKQKELKKPQLEELTVKTLQFPRTYSALNVTDSGSNCKLSIIDSIYSITNFFDNDTAKDRMDQILKQSRGLVYVHTIDKEIKDFLLHNYDHYFCNEVPAGYGGPKSIQYHILLRNTNGTTSEQYLKTGWIPKLSEQTKVDESKTKKVTRKRSTAKLQ